MKAYLYGITDRSVYGRLLDISGAGRPAALRGRPAAADADGDAASEAATHFRAAHHRLIGRQRPPAACRHCRQSGRGAAAGRHGGEPAAGGSGCQSGSARS